MQNYERYLQVIREELITRTCMKRQEADAWRQCPFMTIRGIYDFVIEVRTEDIRDVIGQLIRDNRAVAEEGLACNYGTAIGRTLLTAYGDDVRNRAKAYAAAGVDAVLGGCGLPAVSISGSVSQGLTASLPVMMYGEDLMIDDGRLYRALSLSVLLVVFQNMLFRSPVGFCRAVPAGAAAGAGIAYLKKRGLGGVIHTLINTMAITSGIICEGDSPSCSSKVATSVEAGIIGFQMYEDGNKLRNERADWLDEPEKCLIEVAKIGR